MTAVMKADSNSLANDNDDNASSDMNEMDLDKMDPYSPSMSAQGSPKNSPKPRDKEVAGSRPKRPMSKTVAARFVADKKKLEKHVGEGEVLVPVPRARRRLKGCHLGYMVKRGHTVTRYIDKDAVVYNPNDTAYLVNREKAKPYFVCAIQRFHLVSFATYGYTNYSVHYIILLDKTVRSCYENQTAMKLHGFYLDVPD